ncbi:hypothetical protein G5C51_04405 [Streptomyces sp. A7024]|uniref:Uncharacterized protein n=1 Tax=Streptomyces coryli TaxID=1128680 RepID=A0A6G4TSZ9_9ACTN|nr:hypothetical protein [Streptomyces coryli]NGN63149.1 hypothetical protein [Streptomyces coryli]
MTAHRAVASRGGVLAFHHVLTSWPFIAGCVLFTVGAALAGFPWLVSAHFAADAVVFTGERLRANAAARRGRPLYADCPLCERLTAQDASARIARLPEVAAGSKESDR